MNKREIRSIVRLTVEWLEYLDIYKIEGCTEHDILQGLETGGRGGRRAALAEKMDTLTRKEWKAVVAEVIEAVNAELYPDEELEEA
jgi:hypothetical protein